MLLPQASSLSVNPQKESFPKGTTSWRTCGIVSTPLSAHLIFTRFEPILLQYL